MPDIAVAVSTVGLVVPFILTDPALSGASALPISNAGSVTCTWMNPYGVARALTLSQTLSATFAYTLSTGDTRVPHLEEGWLRVSLGSATYFTSAFTMIILPH